MRILLMITALVFSASSFVGCGGGGESDAPTLAAVSGKVVVNGKPESGLTVEFHPDKNAGTTGPMSTGVTSDDGSFVLSTGTGQAGAVVGKHKVLVKCPWRLEGEEDTETADGFGSSEDGSEPAAAKSTSKACNVNAKFESSDQTPLTAEVPAGGVNDLLLQASSN